MRCCEELNNFSSPWDDYWWRRQRLETVDFAVTRSRTRIHTDGSRIAHSIRCGVPAFRQILDRVRVGCRWIARRGGIVLILLRDSSGSDEKRRCESDFSDHLKFLLGERGPATLLFGAMLHRSSGVISVARLDRHREFPERE